MTDDPYDSTADTLAHIEKVRELLGRMTVDLVRRAEAHDASKLKEPEKSGYDRAVPEMRKHPFGSPELKEATKLLGPALQHHFKHNSHHPEHYERGIGGMDLLDLIEMVCDWKAAAHRPPGDGTVKLEVSVKRFKIQHQLEAIIENTLERYLP